MRGMNSQSGLSITDNEHLRQSIADILKTPIGSRVMLPEYGSGLHSLIDDPFDQSTRLKMIAASADAVHRWEKRVQLVSVDMNRDGNDGPIEIKAQFLPKDADGLSDVAEVVL